MSYRPPKMSNQNRISVGVIALSCVGALVLLNRFTNPPSSTASDPASQAADSRVQPAKPRPQPNYVDDPVAGAAYLKKLIVKTKGDYNKLSNDDKAFANSITMGHSQMMFRDEYAKIRKKAASWKTRAQATKTKVSGTEQR